MYNIIFTQRKSIKNFNRSLTILGGEVVGGASRTGNDGSGGSGGRWERWEVWEGVGAVGVVEVNYVLWLGGGVFDFFAGLIHSLSDAALL